MTGHELDPAAEVVHLRRLLDIQPSCLMRLGADGVVLAANDAALTLLGMTSHAQALGRDFAEWVSPDQQDQWRAFARKVVEGAPASLECVVAAPTGVLQTVLFHGTPLPWHPDGVASMAVAARAVSGQRHLEAAVVEREELLREFEAEQAQARERLAAADAHRRQLEEQLQALEGLLSQAERHRAAAPDEALVRGLRAELEAREAALAAAVAARDAAEAARRQTLAERGQLEAALEEYAARHARVTEERAAERQRVLQMLDAVGVKHREELAAFEQREREARDAAVATEQREREARDAAVAMEQREQEGKAQRAALLARLEQALVMCQQYEADRQHRERALRDLVDERAALMADRDRLARALRDSALQLTALADEVLPSGGGSAAGEAAAVPAMRLERSA